MRRWVREFRFPWRSDLDVRREVDAELDFHLAMRAEELERDGLAPAAAQREAARQFGDVEATRSALASRGQGVERVARARAALEALYRDVRYALRSLGRNAAFTVTASLVLALGIGASAAVFAVLDTVVLRPLPLRAPERLLAIGEQPPADAQWTMQTVRLAVLKQWQANTNSFERLDGYATPQLTWRGPEGPERIVGGALIGDLFGVVGATMVLGGAFTGDEHANAPAVLSDAFWRQRFGGRRDVVGERLELDGISYTIVGVLPPEAAAVLDPAALVWIALDRATVTQDDAFVRVVGRLRAGVEKDAAIAELAAQQRAVEQERGFTPPSRGVVARSVQQKRAELFGATLVALFGGALLLVLIASANVGTLLLTRLVERRHEFAVRASLGAGRWRVVRQVLTEHVVLWVIGGGAGLALGALALRAVARALPLAAAADPVAIDGRVMLFAGGITLLTALVFGLLPALESAERNPVLALREDGTAVSAAGRGRRWRQSLVVAQVALSTLLASSACLLALSFFNLTSQPLGFRPEEMRTFRVQLPARDYPDQSARRLFQQQLLAELRTLSGVESVGTTSAPPLGTIIVGPIGIEGDAARDERLWAAMQAVDRDYFAGAGTALEIGRAFAASDDVNGERVAIVNAAFVSKYFSDGNPLGRRVALGPPGSGGPWLRIVGVVEDVKHAGLDFEYFPEIFVPYEQVADGPAGIALGADIYTVLRVPDAFAPSEGALRNIVASIDPGLPIMELDTGAELVAKSAEGAEVRASVMVAIAALAVLLAGLGLYAVLSQAVAQRRKELGIRMALGATPASLVQAVCRHGVALAVFGVAGGALAALVLAQYVRSLLYGIGAFEPIVLGVVAAFMLVVAVAAAAVPGWRATRLSPTLAIRSGALALFAAALCAPVAQSWSQPSSDPLPRRGWFGVALGTDEAGAVIVTSVQPGSTAEEIGIETGDVVRTVDGRAMQTPADVIVAIGGTHRAGDRVTLEVARAGVQHTHVATLKPFPTERVSGSEVEYDSVTLSSGVRLRTIVTVPTQHSGPAPAVFVLQGGGCSSLDNPLAMPIGVVLTIHRIAEAGFVTLRVDKSGLGDSEGPHCATIGYQEELDGYRAALRAFRAHAAVDRDRIFLVGISLGGVFAPILANETRVAGISTWGTIAFAPSPYPGRSERFFAEFAPVDVLAQWANIDVPVQVLHGEFDDVSMREWSESIVATIEAAHPSRVEHREFPGLDHCSTRHATREAAVGHCGAGEFSADPDDAIVAFLEAHR